MHHILRLVTINIFLCIPGVAQDRDVSTTHIINNRYITSCTSLADGKLAFLIFPEEVELVGRFKDDFEEFHIIKIPKYGNEYFALYSFLDTGETIALKLKSDANLLLGVETKNDLILLKDTTRMDAQNQDFIIPGGGTQVTLLHRGATYSKIATQFQQRIYVGYILTSQVHPDWRLHTGIATDIRSNFDFDLVADKKVEGKYKIDGQKNGRETFTSIIEIARINGLFKFRVLTDKLTIDNNVIYETTHHDATYARFIFYNRVPDGFRFSHPNLGTVHYEFSGTNTVSGEDLAYSIKKIL